MKSYTQKALISFKIFTITILLMGTTYLIYDAVKTELSSENIQMKKEKKSFTKGNESLTGKEKLEKGIWTDTP